MKKINISLTILALVSLCITSCSKSDDEEENEFFDYGYSYTNNYKNDYSVSSMDSIFKSVPKVVTTPYLEVDDIINSENFLRESKNNYTLYFGYTHEKICYTLLAEHSYKPNAANTAFEGSVVFHGLKNKCSNSFVFGGKNLELGKEFRSPYHNFDVEIDEEALSKAEIIGVQDAKTASIECSFDIPAKYLSAYSYRLQLCSSEDMDMSAEGAEEITLAPGEDGKHVVNIASYLHKGEKTYYRAVIVSNATQEAYKGKVKSVTGK